MWRPSVWRLKLGPTSVMQQDNHPKQSNRFITEWLKQKRIKVLEWTNQSPDLNLTEIPWKDINKCPRSSVKWTNIVKSYSKQKVLMLKIALQSTGSWSVLSCPVLWKISLLNNYILYFLSPHLATTVEQLLYKTMKNYRKNRWTNSWL